MELGMKELKEKNNRRKKVIARSSFLSLAPVSSLRMLKWKRSAQWGCVERLYARRQKFFHVSQSENRAIEQMEKSDGARIENNCEDHKSNAFHTIRYELTRTSFKSFYFYTYYILSWQLSDCGFCQYHLKTKSAIT